MVSEVLLFVENNITASSPTDRKENGPDMTMRKIRNYFEPMDS